MTLDVRHAAERWAATWRAGWERLDVDPIVALYAPDVVFSSQPFREPYRGRDGVRAYVTAAFEEESTPRVWMSPPIVDGRRAVVSWWAALGEAGVDATLAGASLLRFDDRGMVIEQWDAWNQAEGRLEPPTWSPPSG